MLVLTRQVDEKIIIDDNIIIKVIKINDDQVKIGIEAPKHISINRAEIKKDKSKYRTHNK